MSTENPGLNQAGIRGLYMESNELNLKIIHLLKSELGEIKEEMGELIRKIKNMKEESLEKDLDLLEFYLKTIVMDENMKDVNNVFRTITIVGSTESELDLIGSKINALKGLSRSFRITSPLKGGALTLIGSIKSKLKNLSVRLWQFLSQMMNLNEWSVTGSSSLNICGFSGGVTLQLTFGA